jgi:N-methylhydantoinase A
LNTPIYGAEVLIPGTVVEGPAVCNPGQTTYLVEPGWRMEVANQGAVWFFKQGDEG